MNQNTQLNAGTQCIARTCQVEESQKNLALQIEALIGSLENLEQRLAPVLQPCGPCDPATKAVPEEMLVAVAADYRERYKQVQLLTSRVSSMLSRLELP